MGRDPNSHRIEALSASYLEWLGDEILARELALTVLPDIPTQLDLISDAIDVGDHVTLHAAAHRLKGALGVFGEHPAFELAARLEAAGRAGQVDEARSLRPAFERAVDDFSHAAEALSRRPVSGD